MGWLQRKMDEAQRQAIERSGGQPASDGKTASGSGTTDAIEVDAVPARNGASRGRTRNGKRKGGGKGAASSASTGVTARAQGRDNGATGAAVSAPAGAVIVPRKAKPVSQENRGE
jgi:hypothetical protein